MRFREWREVKEWIKRTEGDLMKGEGFGKEWKRAKRGWLKEDRKLRRKKVVWRMDRSRMNEEWI